MSTLVPAVRSLSRPALPGLTILDARYRDPRFGRHVHETYSLGLMLSGANRFYHKRGTQLAPSGTICVINPGEVHTGEAPSDDGWHYVNLYIDETALHDAQEALGGARAASVSFTAPVITDSAAVHAFAIFAQTLLDSSATPLQLQTHWLALCDVLLSQHVDHRTRTDTRTPAAACAVAKEILSSDCTPIDLTQLAQRCGLSPFQLVRAFTAAYGLPPHAYHTAVRLERAKQRILTGEPLARVAADLHFADQAHFTRRFRRHFGITPGALAR